MLSDLVQQILDRSGAGDDERGLAQEAFESAPHEAALAEMLPHLDLPQHTKADLWEAKHQSAALSDPKAAKLMLMARLPEDVLARAEKYPHTAKLIASDAKQEKPKAKTPAAETDADGEKTGDVHFVDSTGQHHTVPAEHLDAAKAIDPGLAVL